MSIIDWFLLIYAGISSAVAIWACVAVKRATAVRRPAPGTPTGIAWRRIEDGTPPKYEQVLVWCERVDEHDIAQFCGQEGWLSTVSGEVPYPVTHWATLDSPDARRGQH